MSTNFLNDGALADKFHGSVVALDDARSEMKSGGVELSKEIHRGEGEANRFLEESSIEYKPTPTFEEPPSSKMDQVEAIQVAEVQSSIQI